MPVNYVSGYSPYSSGFYTGYPASTNSAGEKTQNASGDSPVTSEDAARKAGRKSSPEECQTCKNRKYVDGSDENVSFKSPSHVSPEAAGARVRAHEGEHVANAYSNAQKNDGKVLRASVSIHTDICPECGRTFVSGGTTNTMIKYSDESNPYQKNQKSLDAAQFVGKNIDYAA